MTATDFLRARFVERQPEPAVADGDVECSFGQLVERWDECSATLAAERVPAGSIVGLESDFSATSIAMFLALIGRGCIVVPLGAASHELDARKRALAELEFAVSISHAVEIAQLDRVPSHTLYRELRRRRNPGLVLFSSGTSGEPKAAVHDFTFLLEKFRRSRPALRTLAFLPMDHWGGLNTMLHTLANGACLVTVGSRRPEDVCIAIEQHAVELLPSTPTFLNLLLLSEAHRRHDLSSLRLITYGAEPMPESTLRRLARAFPAVRLQQTYGLIEVGVLRSKSREDGSLWVKLGGEGYETRVVDGILQIRTPSTILGYLNAPTPITSDGWFVTGDAVLQDGEYFRVLGRTSELINVGGDKVHPSEIESVIQSMESVAEATVYGEKNRIVGEIVCARVAVTTPVDPDEFAIDVKRHCAERLERFKVPVKVQIVEHPNISHRFKKSRRTAGA